MCQAYLLLPLAWLSSNSTPPIIRSCTHSICYVSGLLAATASVVEFHLNHASGSSKQAWHIQDAVCTVLELLMMGEETARNMYSIDNNQECCITLGLVGCI